jgi:hypothetical protein
MNVPLARFRQTLRRERRGPTNACFLIRGLLSGPGGVSLPYLSPLGRNRIAELLSGSSFPDLRSSGHLSHT